MRNMQQTTAAARTQSSERADGGQRAACENHWRNQRKCKTCGRLTARTSYSSIAASRMASFQAAGKSALVVDLSARISR
jgi:hypothetical protein